MATPIRSQPAINDVLPLARPSEDSANAKTMLEMGNTRWPPKRSINLPDNGPRKPETRRPSEKAINTHGVLTPSSAAIGFARIAGR